MLKKIFFLVITSVIVINLLALYANIEQQKIDNLCKVYTYNGKPELVIVNGNEYNLSAGNIFQPMFINQFDKEQLQNLQDCIFIEKE